MSDEKPTTFKVGDMTLREQPNGDGLQVLGEDGLWYDMTPSSDSAHPPAPCSGNPDLRHDNCPDCARVLARKLVKEAR
jgi:hypothetical protein